jgi:phosphoribosylcarboxyaminoimidazole (NCAIR) mutase
MEKPKVGIVMGSDSDLPIMKQAGEILDEFGISYEIKIASAHSSHQIMQKELLKMALKSLLQEQVVQHIYPVLSQHTYLFRSLVFRLNQKH